MPELSEILFAAGRRPARQLAACGESDLRTLYPKTRQVLRAIHAGGEPDFQDAPGRRGWAPVMMYRRAGQPCLVCGHSVLWVRLGGRPTFYCATCQ